MIRAYLDWNVIVALKAETADHKFANLILENLQSILIPFSNGHIQDLQKGAKDPKYLPLIRKDLDYLDFISNKNCLLFDIKKNITEAKIGSSHDLFDSFSETNDEDFFNPEKIEETFQDLGFPSIGQKIIENWRQTQVDIDFSKFETNDHVKDYYSKHLPRTRKENNLYNLMLDFSEFYERLKKDPSLYKRLLEIFRNQVGLDPKIISNFKKPFDDLNKILKDSKIGFDLDALTNINTDENNNLVRNNFSKYSMEYAGLDMSGFHPDTFNKKNLFSNFTIDSYHSFFGGHCDYFVSFEKKLLLKSYALYRKYGIDTKAVSPKEFCESVSPTFENEFDIKYLINSISKTIESGFVKEIITHSYNDTNIYLYQPQNPILAYFNYLQLKKDHKNRSTIFLVNSTNTLSRFIFYSEIESIVAKCVKIFGNDLNNRSVFATEEREQINNGSWPGRSWVYENFLVALFFFEEANRIDLIFEEITDDYIESKKNMHMR